MNERTNRQSRSIAAMAIGAILCLITTTHVTAEVSLVDSTVFDDVILDLTFYDGMHGYALAGSGYSLLRTTDGGVNWVAENIHIGTFYSYKDVATIGETGLLLGDQAGSIWYRAHPDSTWYPTWSGDNKEIREIEVIDENGWAAITDSLVIVTRDQGKSYTTYTHEWSANRHFSSLDVTDANLMHVTFGEFLVLRSTDGGITFDQLDGPERGFGILHDVRFVTPDIGWVASHYPWNLFQTTDGGKTWTYGPFEYPTSIGISPEGVSAYVTWSLLRTSNDGGLTWTDSLPLPELMIDDRTRNWGHQQVVTTGDRTYLLIASEEANRSIIARIDATSGVENEGAVMPRFLDLD